MKNKVLLICLSLLISLGVSAQKHTIYIDDFNSEIKIPNKVLSTIRNVVLNGIQQTNRVNIIDAVSVGANLNLSPLEDARRFRADYLLRGHAKLLTTEVHILVTTAARTVLKRSLNYSWT